MIPSKQNAAFVAAMEDVLEIHTRPHVPARPLFCLDETSMLFAPLEGWRHVAVRERRSAVNCAYILRELADTHLPNAQKTTLVQDNLNTHKSASLYEAFVPPEARRITERFE